MIFAFLSARLRRWILLAFVLPLVGRVLEALGVRIGGRSPRAGSALRSAGGSLRGPRSAPGATGRGWRRRR